MIISKNRSDYFGSIASFFCLIHCIVTPLIYVVNVKSFCCQSSTPFWWKSLDYIFLFISFIAVYWSIKSTNINWMKLGLSISWLLLFVIILNEKMMWFPLSEHSIYIPSISLIVLHIYNAKFCRCSKNEC